MAGLPISSLQPGDLLLCMGKGEISKLIAWVGANDYSHCAVVCDSARLIEAAASGARYVDLAKEQSLGDEYVYIDALRNHHQDASALAGANLDAFLVMVRAYVGRPYDLDKLVDGDRAWVEFEGRTYEYAWRETVITTPDDVSVLADGVADLTMTACHPKGFLFQRIVAFWQLVGSAPTPASELATPAPLTPVASPVAPGTVLP